METKFTNEFLMGVLENQETSIEDKIKLILSEHEADKTGLIAKRDELLKTIAKNKATIEELTNSNSETVAKVANLEEELKKKNPEDLKKLLENQFLEKENGFKQQIEQLTAERDRLKANDLKRLLNESIEEGIKDLNFMEGLKDGFIARVKSLYNFEPKEIDGQIRFLTADMKAPKDVMHEFALSNEGKAYIKNPSTGGNATGSGSFQSSLSGQKNPWKKETWNVTEQWKLMQSNKALADRMKAEANNG